MGTAGCPGRSSSASTLPCGETTTAASVPAASSTSECVPGRSWKTSRVGWGGTPSSCTSCRRAQELVGVRVCVLVAGRANETLAPLDVVLKLELDADLALVVGRRQVHDVCRGRARREKPAVEVDELPVELHDEVHRQRRPLGALVVRLGQLAPVDGLLDPLVVAVAVRVAVAVGVVDPALRPGLHGDVDARQLEVFRVELADHLPALGALDLQERALGVAHNTAGDAAAVVEGHGAPLGGPGVLRGPPLEDAVVPGGQRVLLPGGEALLHVLHAALVRAGVEAHGAAL